MTQANKFHIFDFLPKYIHHKVPCGFVLSNQGYYFEFHRYPSPPKPLLKALPILVAQNLMNLFKKSMKES